MPSIQELREKRSAVKNEILSIRDDVVKNQKDGKTGADLYGGEERQKRWDTVNTELNELDKAIANEERAAEVLRRGEELEREQRSQNPFKQPGQKEERKGSPLDAGGDGADLETDFGIALQAFFGRRSASHEKTQQACQRFGIDPARNDFEFRFNDTPHYRGMQAEFQQAHAALAAQRNVSRARETRAMSGQIMADGGILVPGTFVATMEANMLAVGGVERVAEILLTDRGEEMTFPSFDDTANEGSIIGENTDLGNADNPDFKGQKWHAWDFTSGILKVPNNLIEDSPANLPGLLAQALGERLGRIGNRRFTTGTGVNQPRGIITAASVGVTAASTTTIAAEEVIALYHSVDPSYRDLPGAGFMCHDNIISELRQKKDSNGQFIWQPGLSLGVPDRIMGKPYTYNQHMDSACAASNKTLLFGDFASYKIRRVRNVRVIRLNERFADTNQTGFSVIIRQDGNLMNAGTARVKYLQQAAS